MCSYESPMILNHKIYVYYILHKNKLCYINVIELVPFVYGF